MISSVDTNVSIYAIDNDSSCIEHWGRKGQKWGIRHYQNYDGTLTEAGKKRYGTVKNFNAALKEKEEAKAARKKAKVERIISSGDVDKILKNRKKMTNQQLQEAITRINVVKKIKSLAGPKDPGIFEKATNTLNKVATFGESVKRIKKLLGKGDKDDKNDGERIDDLFKAKVKEAAANRVKDQIIAGKSVEDVHKEYQRSMSYLNGESFSSSSSSSSSNKTSKKEESKGSTKKRSDEASKSSESKAPESKPSKKEEPKSVAKKSVDEITKGAESKSSGDKTSKKETKSSIKKRIDKLFKGATRKSSEQVWQERAARKKTPIRTSVNSILDEVEQREKSKK